MSSPVASTVSTLYVELVFSMLKYFSTVALYCITVLKQLLQKSLVLFLKERYNIFITYCDFIEAWFCEIPSCITKTMLLIYKGV